MLRSRWRSNFRQRNRTIVSLIGVFKLVKGALLIAFGLGLIRFGGGFSDVLAGWARDVHVDPDGRHLGRGVQAIALLSGWGLGAVSGGIFAYAALFLTEGTGLLLHERWAEYFTIIVTSSFVPLELFEFLRRPDGLRLALVLVNVAVVYYLASGIRRR